MSGADEDAGPGPTPDELASVEKNAPKPHALKAKQQRLRILDLRVAGWSVAQIGRSMGLQIPRVAKVLDDTLEKFNRLEAHEADELRRLELMRLDELLKNLWPDITGLFFDGKEKRVTTMQRVRAVEAALKVCESRRKLLGLDAPLQSTIKVDQTVHQLSAHELVLEYQRIGLEPPAIPELLPLPGEVVTIDSPPLHLGDSAELLPPPAEGGPAQPHPLALDPPGPAGPDPGP